jgi:hypothetical protein
MELTSYRESFLLIIFIIIIIIIIAIKMNKKEDLLRNIAMASILIIII